MPSAKRKGKTGIYIELPDELHEQLVGYCTKKHSQKVAEIRLAIRRHLAFPPRDELEPLEPEGRKRK